MFTLENFTNGLIEFLKNFDFEETHDEIIFKQTIIFEDDESENDKIVFSLSKTDILNELNALNDYRFEGYALLNDNSFEIAVQRSEDSFLSNRYIERDMFRSEGHGYELCITKPSIHYIVALICKIGLESNNDENIRYYLLFRRYYLSSTTTYFDDFFNCFKIITAKIKSEASLSHNEFNKLLNSYLYNIAFNRNVVLSRVDFKEEKRPIRRHLNRGGQLFPYNNYNGELIKYYYQALSSSIPFAQYLAFYHVAEFFFQQIAENEAFDTIESMITHPSFSPYKKEEIRRFYNKVSYAFSKGRWFMG